MNNTKTVLITGATGLVGSRLKKMLFDKGYAIKALSTRKELCDGKTIFYWNYETQTIDDTSFENVDYIIHLAGANIAEKKWTPQQKQLIVNSRTKTTNLLFDLLTKRNHSVKAFISSSATGYYGAITSDKIFTETDSFATDFLGTTCKQWENAVQKINSIGIRTVILRTGIVLDKNGGAVPKLILPAKYGLASSLGSGNQYFPWIHIDDLCNMYIKAIEDSALNGVYNAVAPQHITNKEFTTALAKSIHRPYYLPNVPAFILKLFLGEMAVMLLEGSKIACDKIQTTGFQHKYQTIDDAFKNITLE